jgi:hypothetical protein
MARLTREFVSVERAQRWLTTYDPDRLSDEVVGEMVKEVKAGKKRRWYGAVVVDQATDVCHEGLMLLRAIVNDGEGRMCWVARAGDFHFSRAQLEHTPAGPVVLTREMDRVRETPLPLPYEIIGDDDLPPHLRGGR